MYSHKLIKDILYNINQIPNTKTTGRWKDTYELCSSLGKYIRNGSDMSYIDTDEFYKEKNVIEECD
jgi:hypothetical protein